MRIAKRRGARRLTRLEQLEERVLLAFATPLVNFDGIGFTGARPSDTVGDVGPNHYVQATNAAGGTRVAIYQKDGTTLDTFLLDSLAPPGSDCANGRGDPIVAYDHLADRWVLLEFVDDAVDNALCVYVSKTGVPTSDPDDWYAYEFETPNFPDYPKLAVWPDAYYIGTNEGDNPVYALERSAMLQGNPAKMVRRSGVDLPNWARNHIMPVDLDGAPPPPGTPGIFVRQVDDEVTNPGSADPNADFLEIWQFDVDFVTPANSTYTLAQVVPIQEFDYWLGDPGREDIEQPGTSQQIDALPHYMHYRVTYRVFDGYEALVGSFTVDANEDSTPDYDGGTAEEQAGIRWFELRRSGTPTWTVYQEGTYAPDDEHHWMGSTAINELGEIALGYSVSSKTVYPSIRYAGRQPGDPLGALPDGEHTIVTGGGWQSGNPRWGDYSSMTVDPADGRTFWYTTQYIDSPGSGWQTRVAALSFGKSDIYISADDLYGDGTNTGGNDFDEFLIRRNGPMLEVFLDGQLSRTLLYDAVERLIITGSDDADWLVVDNSAGQSIPVGGIDFDGRGDSLGGDRIILIGSSSVGSYLPDPAVTGAGTLQMDGGSIRFQDLEPIVISGFAEFTFISPNSNDDIQIVKVSNTSNKITGTSGGVAFETLEFYDVTNLALDLASNDDPLDSPNDRVRFMQDVVATGLNRITIRTGPGKDLVDAINVTSTPIEFDAGDGEDHFWSGGAADVFNGGAGPDLLHWGRGDAADYFIGGDGEDQARMVGDGGNQAVVLGANGTVATVTVDGTDVTLAGVEDLNLDLDAGDDGLVMQDITTTALRTIVADFGTGTSQTARVLGTGSDDVLTVDLVGTGIELTGVGPTIELIGLDSDDLLTIDLKAGSDTLQATGVAAAVTIDRSVNRIAGIAQPPVAFIGTETLAIDVAGPTANLWITEAEQYLHAPDVATDRGTLWADGLEIRYRGLTGGTMPPKALHLAGPATGGTATLRGTDQSDAMAISGSVVTTAGRANVVLHQLSPVTFELLDGDDSLAAYPTGGLDLVVDGGGPGQSDSLEVIGTAGADAISVDLDVQTISGVGSTISFAGIESVQIDGGGGADTLTVLGREVIDDTLRYRPHAADGGRFTLDGLVTSFRFDAIPGTFTVDLLDAVADTVVVSGTNNHDVITVDSPARVVSVENAAGTVLKPVQLADTVEHVSIEAGLGNDTVLVIPAPAAATSTDGQPYNRSVSVDGGPPGASDALVVAQAGGAPLPASDFVVLYRGRDADQGRVRVYRNAVAMPDISYRDIEVVSPITDPGVGRDNNLLIAGPDLYEPNQFRATAAFLGSGERINVSNLVIFPNWGEHRFVPADEDWFRVVAYQTGTLDVQAYFRQFDPALLPAGGDLQLEIYDEDGTLIAGNGPLFGTNDTDDDERVRIPVVAGETYYVRVFGAPAGSPTSPVVNAYDLTIINDLPPTPYDLELDDLPTDPNYDCTDDPPSALNSDTGRNQTDNVTCDNSPTIVLRLDDAILLQDLPGNPGPQDPPDEVIPIPFNPSIDPADTTPGYRVAVFVEGDPQVPGIDPQEPVGFAQPSAVPGVYVFDFDNALNGAGLDLPDGSHFISARVEMTDPADPTRRGFGPRSESLEIFVDTVAPPVAFGEPSVANDGLHPDSDTGIVDQPDTFVDRITADTTPTWWGVAEANAIVRVYADLNGDGLLDPGSDLFLGETVAVPTDGSDQFPRGLWEFRTEIDLNDPSYFPQDGLRTIFVTAEDLAGNVSSPQSLEIFVDTRGPRVTNIEYVPLSGGPNVPVFTPKPLAPTFGPTPLTQAIDITFEDEPVRVNGAVGFVYPAVNPVLATTPGNYRLVGDANGHILIADVLFLDATVAGDIARTTVRLVFATPLPDDRFTLTITDRLADRAGNRLDGDVQATGPGTAAEVLPSGDGVPGEDFVGRFTVDSRPEIAVFNDRLWFVDLNGNGIFDPDNRDATNRDIVWRFGQPGDWPVTGDWDGDGFDEIGVYGLRAGTYMFELDVNGNGTLDGGDAVFTFGNVNAQPIAADWNGDGVDEVGLYFNKTWWLDLNGNMTLDAGEQIATNMAGHPVAGDWDGDGDGDVGVYRTYQPGTTPVNRWLLDLDDNFQRNAGDLVIAESPPVGGRKRPVAADWNARGQAKIGIFKINPQEREAEWFLDVDRDGQFEPPPTGTPGIPLVDQDIFYRFGDRRSEPVVGNFDPPPAGAGTEIPELADDVGDRPGQAHRLPVGDEPVVLRSRIEEPTDRDWYAFRAVKNGRVAIDVTTPQSPLDPMIVVKLGKRTVARNGNYGGTLDSHVEFTVRQGRQYRILVRGQRNTVGDYVLSAQYLKPARDDHAGSRARATRMERVPFGTRVLWIGAGRIERARDRDMFSFEVTANGTYRIKVDNRTLGFDSVLTVIAADGSVLGRLATAEAADPTYRYDMVLELSAGRYWVRVEGHAGQRGDYELTVDEAIADLLGSL